MAVIINGRTAVHQKSKGKLHTTDVCLTPPHAIPIPYSNLAESKDLQKTARTVFINGYPMAHKKSVFYKSSGDEGGTMMGIKSQTIGGKAEFLQGSPNVFCEGFPAARQLDKMVSNNRNTAPQPLMQPGGRTPEQLQAILKQQPQQQTTQYLYPIDVVGNVNVGTIGADIIAHNRDTTSLAALNQPDPDNATSTLRRININNLTQDDVYLTLRIANTEGAPIDIPVSNNMLEVSEVTTEPVTANTTLVPCTFSWMNHPANHQLKVNAGDFTDIARFADDLRQDIYQQLLKCSEQQLQQQPWTELITPNLLQQINNAMQSSHNGQQQQHVDDLNPGFIYIYKNGYLWREIACNVNGSYSEVNLIRYAGCDQRPATGVMSASIVLPQKIEGKTPTIEVCYSPVQWSWARINYFGGMNRNDLRIAHKKKTVAMPADLPPSNTPNNPASNRAKRMQRINLTPFATNSVELNHTISGDETAPDLMLIQQSYFPTVLLADPLGLAARLCHDLTLLTVQLQRLMHQVCKEPRFQTALLCQQIFFNPNTAFSKKVTETLPLSNIAGVNGDAPETITGHVDNAVKQAASNLDRDKVNAILRVKQRAAVRNLIHIMQRALVQLISNTQPMWYNSPIAFNTEFTDLCANGEYDYSQVFASMAGILSNVTFNPHSLDSGLDIELASKAPFVPPPGVDYIKQLTQASHPLYRALFPTQTQIDDMQKQVKHDPHYAQSITPEKCHAKDSGDGAFNAMAFAMSFQNMKANTEALLEGLTSMHKSFSRVADKTQAEINLEHTVKWYHASGQPVLAEVKTATTGTIPEGYDIIGFDQANIEQYYRKTVFDYQQTVESSSLSSADKQVLSQHLRAGSVPPEHIQSKLKLEKINLVAQVVNKNQSAANMGQATTAEEQAFNHKILRQFTQADFINNTGASFIDEASANEIHTSITVGEFGRKLNQKVLIVHKAKPWLDRLDGFNKGLSVLLLAMQTYNLITVRRATVKYKKRSVKAAKIFQLLGYTGYAVEATYLRFQDVEYVRQLYHFYHQLPEENADWVLQYQKFMGNTLGGARLTLLATAGVVAIAIGTVFSVADLLHQIKEDNPGEAAADVIEMGGNIFSVLAIFAEYAGKATVWGAIEEFFSPFSLGLIGAVLGLVALIVAVIFTDTPLEKWTKHCPLSLKHPDNTMTEYTSCTSLLSLLLTPTVTIQQLPQQNNSAYQNIEVYIALPAFTIGDSSLQVETTYAKDDVTTSGTTSSVTEQGKQQQIIPSQIQQCIDAQGRVVAMRYIYQNIPAKVMSEHDAFNLYDNQQIHYRTRVRLYTHKYQYCLPYVKQETGAPKRQPEPKKLQINTQQPGWLYAEANLV